MRRGDDASYMGRATQELLADTVSQVSGPDTTVLFASPDEGELFFERMRTHGFDCEDISRGPAVVAAAEAIEGMATDGGLYSPRGEVRVTCMRMRAGASRALL